MKPGFSLIELTIVIAIIALISSFSISFIFVSDATYVQLELDRLYAYMMYLQRKAQCEHKVQTLLINTQHNTYSSANTTYTLIPRVMFDVIEEVKGPPADPHKTISSAVTFQNNCVYFYPDRTTSAGTIYMTDKSKKSLYAISLGVTEIAYIRRYVYKNGWQLLHNA